jgi:hypothetical protein
VVAAGVCLASENSHQAALEPRRALRCKAGRANIECQRAARLIPEHRVSALGCRVTLLCGALAEALQSLHNSLWHTPSKWISDPVGYVFLPRAMREIGEALYPNEWRGDEPTTAIFSSLPSSPAFASQHVKQEVHEVLRKERPDLGRTSLTELPHEALPATVGISPRPISRATAGISARPSVPIITFTDAEWEVAREIYQKRHDEARFARRRYAKVRETVAAGCRSGELMFGTRPRKGGSVRPGKPELWETEGDRLYPRFECFALSRSEPFSIGLRDDAEWICVSRDSLDKFLGGAASAAHLAAALEAPHLSPYMVAALEVVQALNITPDNQPKKEAVMAELRAKWPKGAERSENLISVLATIVREPESQLGRAKKSRPKRAKG